MKRNWTTVWTAVAALGTLLAVGYAIYHQEIKSWFNRPIIDLNWFEPNSLHLVRQMGASFETTGPKEYDGMFITLKLTNKGKQTASDAEAQLTNVAKKIEPDTWKIEKDWIPIPLQWVLGQTPQRDLIPERPYLINLASFSVARNGQLLITYTMSPKSQRETFEPGEYCFEVSVFTIGAPTLKRYIYVTFENFSGVTSPDSIKNFIKKVEMKNTSPW
jgi:hypothetical protein